ncbi:helix-turn-helix transcriptional regulator [Aliarcobacter butzleri]|uniref:helix-turn-helix transcriptional regulator n=1 Tax=Aliarcobacter butzleri TaxID=28197 RepID=UPI002B243EED|nr:helix-turn-helix domain-containing protein [Aliarcobacter butzleri]
MSINNIDLQPAKFKRAKDLAKHLGVGLSTIWKWSKDGKIKPIKLSERVTVFNVLDVEKALFGTVA